jgi:hypothetical protein
MGDLLGLQTYKPLGKPGTIRGMIQVPVYCLSHSWATDCLVRSTRLPPLAAWHGSGTPSSAGTAPREDTDGTATPWDLGPGAREMLDGE